METPSDRRVSVEDDLDAFQAAAIAARWGDGLPLIPPTPARVDNMLNGTDRDRETVLGSVPPRLAAATVEGVATNAVMAGCEPRHLPAVIAAVEAMLEPRFHLHINQMTTHPCTVMVLLNGPISGYAGAQAEAGVFGPGNRANATIGRAIRLVLLNIGGGYPGEGDKATHGTPAKYTFAFPENEAASPWEPYHVSVGMDPGESAVTVLAAEAPHNVNDHISDEPRGLMLTFALSMAAMGSNNAYYRNSHLFVCLGPEHAAILARHGWKRSDVQEYLYERARIPHRSWRQGGMAGMLQQPKWIEYADDDANIPIAPNPDAFRIFVAGGPGRQSMFIPSAATAPSVTRLVTDATGAAWFPPE
jgi:hypothetical protein